MEKEMGRQEEGLPKLESWDTSGWGHFLSPFPGRNQHSVLSQEERSRSGCASLHVGTHMYHVLVGVCTCTDGGVLSLTERNTLIKPSPKISSWAQWPLSACMSLLPSHTHSLLWDQRPFIQEHWWHRSAGRNCSQLLVAPQKEGLPALRLSWVASGWQALLWNSVLSKISSHL